MPSSSQQFFRNMRCSSVLPGPYGRGGRDTIQAQKERNKLRARNATNFKNGCNRSWLRPRRPMRTSHIVKFFVFLVMLALFIRSLCIENVLRKYAAAADAEGLNLADHAELLGRRISDDEEENKHEDEYEQREIYPTGEEDFEQEEEDQPRVPRILLPPRMKFDSPEMVDLIGRGAFNPQCTAWQPGNRTRINLATLPQQMLVDEHYDFVPGSTIPNNPQSYFFCRAARALGWTRPKPLKTPNFYNFWIGKPGPEKRWLRDIATHKVSLVCHGSGDLNILHMKRAKESWEENHIALLERWEDSYMSSMTKVDQFNALKEASSKLGCDPIDMGLCSESYDMSDPTQCESFFAKQEMDESMATALWLAKSNKHVGSGIKFRTFKEAEVLYSKCNKNHTPFLLQRGVENTLLLDGRKWDARVLVLVASHRPTLVYAFDILHMRASLKKIEDPGASERRAKFKSNPGSFLTNSHLQNGPKKTNWEEHNWSHAKMIEYAREAGVENPEIAPEIIFKRAQNVIELVFHSMGTLSDRAGRFKIYGFDFMVDHNLKPTLLEINYMPGADFRLRTAYGKQMFDQLYEDAVTLVHDVQVGSGGNRVKPRHGHFHLTYHRDENAQKFWKAKGP